MSKKHDDLVLVGEQVIKTIRFTLPNAKGVILMMGFIDENNGINSIFMGDEANFAEASQLAVSCMGGLEQHYCNPDQSGTL